MSSIKVILIHLELGVCAGSEIGISFHSLHVFSYLSQFFEEAIFSLVILASLSKSRGCLD